MITLANSDYGVLCFMAGLGWGFGLTATVAAVIIDSIKWRKFMVRGER